jgi:hypothetical protein
MESIFFSSKNARKAASPAAPDGAKQNKLGPLRHWTCEPGSTGVGLLLQIHRSLGVAIFLRVPESDGSRAGEIQVLERTLPAWTFRNTSSSSSAARRTTCQPAHFYRRVRGAYSPTPPCFGRCRRSVVGVGTSSTHRAGGACAPIGNPGAQRRPAVSSTPALHADWARPYHICPETGLGHHAATSCVSSAREHHVTRSWRA